MKSQGIDFLIQTFMSLKSPEIDLLAGYLNQITGLDIQRLKAIIASTTQANSREEFLRQLLKLPLQERTQFLKTVSQGEWSENIKELGGKVPEQAKAFNQAAGQTAAKIEAWVDKERKKSLLARLAQRLIR